MSHVGLRAVEKSFELQTVRISIGDHVPDLSDDRREYEDADQVADYREDVPTEQEARERADQSKEDVITVLGTWTSGPRRSLSPFFRSFFPPFFPPFFPSSLTCLFSFFLSFFLAFLSRSSLRHVQSYSFKLIRADFACSLFSWET